MSFITSVPNILPASLFLRDHLRFKRSSIRPSRSYGERKCNSPHTTSCHSESAHKSEFCPPFPAPALPRPELSAPYHPTNAAMSWLSLHYSESPGRSTAVGKACESLPEKESHFQIPKNTQQHAWKQCHWPIAHNFSIFCSPDSFCYCRRQPKLSALRHGCGPWIRN